MTPDELKKYKEYARSRVAQQALRRWIIDYWAIARTIEVLRSYKATRTIPAVMVTRWWFGEPMTPRHVEAILRIVPLVERRRIKELRDTRPGDDT
jgi:hypothetical protein